MDFEEPHFFYNTGLDRFEYVDELRDHPEADIWHSVIHPNTGDLETDASEIVQLFERSYDFDAKK